MRRILAHPAFLFALLGTSALYAVLAFALETADVPTPEDYAAAFDVVRADGYDNTTDALIVFPEWSLRASEHIREPFEPSDQLSEALLARFRRVYVLVEPDGESAWGDAQQTYPSARTLDDDGRVNVARIDTSEQVVTDFRAALPLAAVQLVNQKSGEQATPCAQPHPEGHRCKGRKKWQRVSREWRLATENGVDVVFAHPPKKNERLEVRHEGVTLGNSIQFRGGFTREGSGGKSDAVTVVVLVNDTKLAELKFPRAFDFRTARIDTTAHAGPAASVTFRIFVEGSNSKAHFVYDAIAVAPREGAQ